MKEDVIKRNLAIAYATSGLIRRIDGEDWIKISEVKQSLNDVPRYERPQGEWTFVQYDANPNIGNWHCSECHYIPHGIKSNFCPNCGADMRKEVVVRND